MSKRTPYYHNSGCSGIAFYKKGDPYSSGDVFLNSDIVMPDGIPVKRGEVLHCYTCNKMLNSWSQLKEGPVEEIRE